MRLSQIIIESPMLDRIKRLLGRFAPTWRARLDPVMDSISGTVKRAYDESKTPLQFLTAMKEIKGRSERVVLGRKRRRNELGAQLQEYVAKLDSGETWDQKMIFDMERIQRVTETIDSEIKRLMRYHEPLVQFFNLVSPILRKYIRRGY